MGKKKKNQKAGIKRREKRSQREKKRAAERKRRRHSDQSAAQEDRFYHDEWYSGHESVEREQARLFSARTREKRRADLRQQASHRFAQHELLPALVPLREQKKIRSRSIANCKRLLTVLGELETEEKTFYRIDFRSHERFVSEHILPEEEALYRFRQEVAKLAQRARQIELEVEVHSLSYSEAYQKVFTPGYRFSHPDFEEEEHGSFSFGFDEDFEDDEEFFCDEDFFFGEDFGGDSSESTDSFFEELDEEELELFARMAFEDEFRVQGASKREREELFQEFFQFFKENFRDGPFGRGSGASRDTESDLEATNAESAQRTGDQALLLKKVYRRVVRLIHPDRLEEQTASVKNLWQRAQDAYRRKDLDTLGGIETLLVFQNQKTARQKPIGDLKTAHRLVKDQVKERRKNLRRLRKGPAWGFSSLSGKEKEQRKKEQLDVITEQRAELEEHQKMMNAWLEWCRCERPVSRKTRNKTNGRRKPQKPDAEQMSMGF